MKSIYTNVFFKLIISIITWIISSILLSIILKEINEGLVVFAGSFAFIISACLMIYFFKIHDSQNKKISTYKTLKSFGNGFLIGIWIPLLSVIVMLLFSLVELKVNEFQITSILKLIFLFLFTAIGEEYFFRGFVYGVFSKYGSTAAILCNSFFFSLAHLINPNSFSKPLQYLILEMVNILLLSILFSLARYYTNQIWKAIGIHFMMNVLQSVMFGFLNGGKRVDSFTTAIITEGNIWNGYQFGLESSFVLTIILLTTILFFRFHYHVLKSDLQVSQ